MISVDHVTVSYRGALALNGASFAAEPGSITSIVGRNGAGKTTLLRAISGSVPMASGSVSLGGSKLPKSAGDIARRGVKFVPESRNVFGDLSVYENLLSGTLGSARRGDRDAIDGVLDRFQILRPLLDRKAKLLSGGERQSLAVARVLVSNPVALLLDEPSLGLSAKWAGELLQVISEIAASRNLVVVVAEQNAALASRTSTKLVSLETGVVQHSGATADVLRELRTTGLLDG